MMLKLMLWLAGLLGITNARSVLKETEEKTPFTLDEFFYGDFVASSWNGTWITENTFIYKHHGDFYQFSVTTKESTPFLNGSILDPYPSAAMSVSPDQSYLALRYQVSSVFRHSQTAVYAIYDITKEEYYDINDKKPVQLAKFDPIGHSFVYVYNNNIYYLSSFSNTSDVIQITSDGVEGVIYNGVPDWVYEEEVMGSGSAIWFSPDGKKLVYAKFNDTKVEEFNYFLYGTPGSLDDQYPTTASIKYPKVGTNNTVVETFVYDIETNRTTKFNLIDKIKWTEENNDYILYDVTWISDSDIVMISTNRVQNESVIIKCNLDGNCVEEVSYSQPGGWLTPHIPKYNEDATKRLEILPQSYETDQFNHLVLTDVFGHNQKRLTYGNREVTTIYGWDKINNLVYYASTLNDTPSQLHISVVNTETTEDRCLTCNWKVDNETCKRTSASFNKNFSHFIKTCTGPNPYYVVVQSLTDETDFYLWTNNAWLREDLGKKLRPTIKDLKVKLESNFEARVRMLLPPNLNESNVYPAIVHVYAGPGTNQISDAYSSGVSNYFVTNRNYIYIYIDGRGSGKDGFNKMFQIYRKMGTVEIEDQIAVTKYLQETYTYIDKNKTGIWGWSYGGFASTWALVKDTENVFKFALAVAPVTSFIYYDTIYSERFMGLPTEEDNLGGYNNTDITRHVRSLRGKLYYIIHGNADDNVHYQQALVLLKALEHADIAFWQQSYPDENHSLSGVYPHLYHTIDSFFARAFGKKLPGLAVW
ncbi:venom dipeptidyl peptidase 4 [Anthonomus grandis grandis]|uniref:venom dipeptidyl peptidase 4 n=1 Tax=Anthonomus grandis grandis TaxID=2921223 RepID=UPI002165E275|nr:venom dipeptidyl peptidase 4 [Anthonomus grandis grandis]